MKTISSWLLGGALAASLAWNWKLQARAEAPASCTGAESCSLALPDLDPGRKAKLDEVCARSCCESDRLEQHALELQRELLASLSAETVDPAAAKKLVDEVSELRRRSLALCVEGVLDVRAVLTGEEVRAMLERCEHTSCR